MAAGLLLAQYARTPELLLVLVFALIYVFAGEGPSILAVVCTLSALRWVHRNGFNSTPAQEIIGYIVGVLVIWACLRLSAKSVLNQQEGREKELRESELNLRLIIDTIPAFVWFANRDGGPAFINDKMAEYLGLPNRGSVEPTKSSGGPSADAISQWKEMLHPDDYDAAYQVWYQAVETGSPYDNVFRMRRFDGAYRWFQSKGAPLRDENGDVIRWYGFNVDIDDARRNEENLSDARDKLSRAMQVATIAELSASLAHEINQPLAALVANGQACRHWLEATPPNLGRIEVTVDRVVRDAEAAAEIVRRIRALFKKAAPNKTALDINDVIYEVLRLVTDQAQRRGIKVVASLAPDLPNVIADKIQVQQLIMNLVQNALEAMSAIAVSEHTLFVYSLFDQQTSVTVSVCDTGCGFSEKQKIFEPFFTTKERGMGMGLAICKSIAEQHGGDLYARLNEDRGTTFSFTLPVAPARQQADQRSSIG